jgi:Flp pilus assembly secretin CpaC
VATVDIIQAAVEATTRYVDAGAPKTAPAPGEKAVKTGAQVLNMMTAKAAAPKTEELIQAAIKPYSLDVKVSRARQGSFTDDQADTFVLEGTVPNQTALTQLLIVVDRMLGGPGSEFKVVANEGGGLQETKTAATEQGTSGQGGTSNRTVVLSSQAPLHPTLAANNLNSNIARGAAVMGKNGRWISFVRVRALPQVQVSVRVLDLDRNMVRTVGANWIEAWSERGARLSKSTQGEVALTIMNGLLTNTATIVDHRLLLTQVITALETKGYARTLSEPNLSTLSGEVATFLVGGDVPIQTLSASTTSTFSGFAFREFGIRLTVRPQVEEDGRTMTLDVYPDVSDVNTNGASGALPGAPAFKRTALVSTTRIKDGESLIIGGLTGKGESPLTEQVPVLGDIPLLGNLFSRKTDRNSERELALILIPKIIYPKPASALALEASETGLQVRSGSFKDPDLGTMQVVPEFFRRDEERR